MRPDARFAELWNDYLEGELDESGIAELKVLLEDGGRLKLAADTYEIHRLLGLLSRDGGGRQDEFVSGTMARLPASEDDFVAGVVEECGVGEATRSDRDVNLEGRKTARGRGVALIGLAAAIVALIAVAGLFFAPSKTGDEDLAQIRELNGSIRWIGNDGELKRELEIGTPLGGGMVESLSTNSWVEIEFRDGTMVAVTGRSQMKISDRDGQKLLHLFRGNVSAEVMSQPEGKPLRLITPTAEAEVLGTQFNVVADAFSTRVTVNEGLIRVTRLADGSVKDVPADHLVVAALEQGAELKVIPRHRPTDSWRSTLPQDELFGKWQWEGDGSLRAMPLLWREHPKAEPVLLFLSSLAVSGDDAPPALLAEGARFRVRGRLASLPSSEREVDGDVIFGFTTHHPKGGFAGKYLTARKLGDTLKEGGEFEIDLDLRSFRRQKECFPESPLGHELVDWFALTVREDAGLEIVSVELSKE